MTRVIPCNFKECGMKNFHSKKWCRMPESRDTFKALTPLTTQKFGNHGLWSPMKAPFNKIVWESMIFRTFQISLVRVTYRIWCKLPIQSLCSFAVLYHNRAMASHKQVYLKYLKLESFKQFVCKSLPFMVDCVKSSCECSVHLLDEFMRTYLSVLECPEGGEYTYLERFILQNYIHT